MLKTIIIELFRDVLASPVVDTAAVAKYVSPSYIQTVDGVTLNYDGFIAHMRKQKEVIASLSVEFLAMVAECDILFTNHVVTVQKKDSSVIQIKVIAQFVFEDNRLIRCDELTRLLSGNHEDRDIGSRH